jgi:probable HAF family extracellular repeat protein
VVGSSVVGGVGYATEWSGGNVINLGGLPGLTDSGASAINNAGQVVGFSFVGSRIYAVEWSGGSVINLGGLPGSSGSYTYSSNDAGQAVGGGLVGGVFYATEWSGGSVIILGGLPGSTYSLALAINNAGQAVGYSGNTTVPESSTWAMMLLGFAGLALAGYRGTKRSPPQLSHGLEAIKITIER